MYHLHLKAKDNLIVSITKMLCSQFGMQLKLITQSISTNQVSTIFFTLGGHKLGKVKVNSMMIASISNLVVSP